MSLPELTYDKAKALAGGDYGKETLRNVGRYVVPICWPKAIDAGGVVLTNGTAFFLQTDRALFGVTAAHVVRAFLEKKGEMPNTVCGLVDSETPLDLERDLIAIGRCVDIATFRVKERVIAFRGKQPITGWPPRTPQRGKGVMLAFPGQSASGGHRTSSASVSSLVRRSPTMSMTPELSQLSIKATCRIRLAMVCHRPISTSGA